ncbi:hypothetical protein HU200_031271 [Digitaria exilis]|uniref:Uncharacterized protein n=1 Tax=Digitaria exilis TaxID=1010633 RepID=A0A835EQF9_9POAL|nr:hypothetical protein HU200_031271 [Digitaria exilis]
MATRRIANNNSDDNNNNDVAIDIPGAEEMLQQVADHGLPANPKQLARSIFWVATCTLVTVLNRVIYKLPPGPIFEGNETAYYLTLFLVFLAGVAEVYAAILLSSAAGRVDAWAAPLLCASVVMLAAVITLGGSPVLVMG